MATNWKSPRIDSKIVGKVPKNAIIALEKSEAQKLKDYKKHNALNNVLANDAYDAEKALVLYDGNLVCKENITYMPVYMASCIRDNKPESVIYSLR